MSRVTQNTVEAEPAFRAQLPSHLQPVPGGGVDAGAVIAAVHFEPDMEPGAGQCFRRFEIIENHAQGDPVPGDLLDVADVRRIERECPGEIGEPAARERLRLEQRGNGDSRCTVGELPAAQLETLVCLDVRAQRDVETSGSLRHVLEIVLHHVAIEQQRGGFDVEHHVLRTRTRALLPMGRTRNSAYLSGLIEYVSHTSSFRPACCAANAKEARQNSWTCAST